MLRTMIATSASFVLLCATPARADEVHQALEAYALYQHDVSILLDADIDSAQAVDAALARLSRHNSDRVSRGWIAYGALTAAQSPAFGAGVGRSIRADGRAPVLSQLRGDLYYARREPAGAAQAIQLILGAASADSARAEQAGARYDAWARASSATFRMASSASRAEPSASVRLTSAMRERLQVGALTAQPISDVSAFGGRGFWDSLSGRDARAPRARGGRERQDYASVTDHMLTLAALIVADAADSERRRVSTLLDEPLTQYCMQMQRLQLRQCIASSHDVSERAYCVGRHGLAGPGSCFSSIVR